MKPDDHRKITHKSIQIYHKHAQTSFSSQLVNNTNKIERGAKWEDTTPPYTRITNWHFYKQNKKLQPTTVYFLKIIPLPVIPTSERRICNLTCKLKSSSPKLQAKTIGRILHHIQDMSTPAHVVPIYHGPKLHDSFEDYSIKHSDSELLNIDIDTNEYESICSDSDFNIMSIYNSAANETLNYLYDNPENTFVLKNGEQGVWNMFWKRCSDDTMNCTSHPYDKVKGFGCYGPYGQKYGISDDIGHDVYKNLHRWILRKQIIDSLRALIAIDSFQLSMSEH